MQQPPCHNAMRPWETNDLSKRRPQTDFFIHHHLKVKKLLKNHIKPFFHKQAVVCCSPVRRKVHKAVTTYLNF
ncbi:hypothetical protein LENED_012353 [Lentinula edodes]|uniref:Uncharacterized protein n=1 Tax=Lentinula edodes TaxID=5353 RepID=A0A1Q3ESE2_LENED|nr:hypothetical protein LENED_012353 [Lentinula edodes]